MRQQVAGRSPQRHATVPYCSYVLQSITPYWKSTAPVLPCTTNYYSSTTLYYKVLLQYYKVLLQYYSSTILFYEVLLQYYSVIQSTTPVLVCTTKYYSTTTLHYKVLLQYYSVLQSTTPVLLCTTKYYSSTSLYYKVLIQYYSVLQILLCTTKCYSVLHSTTPVLHGATPNFTEYCACHESDTWTSPSTAPATKLHQVLRLPRKVTLIIDPLHTWNVSYNARSNKCHCPITHQILRLPRKMNLMIDPWHKWNVIYNARSNMCHSPNSPNTAPATKNDCPKSQRNLLKTDDASFPMRGRSDHDPRMIRPWSEHDPSMKPSVRNPPRNPGYLSRPPRAFCIEKCNVSRSGYHSKFHRILRLPRKVTLELHQVLRLPRKVTLIIDPVHTWNVIYNARITSVIVQTHQILRLPRKMNLMIDPWHKWNVIYNARSNMCHSPNSPNTAPATKNDRPKSQRNLLKTDDTSFPMRGRSDHDPTMIRAWNRPSATRLATEVTFHAHHAHFVLKNTTSRAPAIIPNFTEYCACHEKWHLNFTKYCACHEK